MKRITIILVLVMLYLVIVHPAFANDELSDSIELEGNTYKKIDNGIDLDKEISNIKLNNSNNALKGHFFINDEKVKIDTKFIEKDENDFNYYIGTANFRNKTYNIDIIENNKGLSGLIYDDSRADVTPFVITKNLSSKEDKIKSKDVINMVKSEMKKQESEIQPLEIEVQPFSLGISRSKYIYHSGRSFPYVVSAGTVSGTLYYKTDIPAGKFWVDKVVGTIAWESGFDSLNISNDNEPYGHLWGSPSCPQKRQYTWYVDEIADKPGSYYFNAVVSYRAAPKGIPLLFWNSKKSYISY